MEYSIREIKRGIKIHYIKTNLFKTNIIAIFFTEKLSKNSITKNTLIPAILRRGSENMKTQEEISKNMEELYGAEFDCGIEKIGDNHVLKFYLESLNNDYIITNENLLKESIEKLIEIVFNPVLENDVFKSEYVETEKEKVKQLIESKIDNKDKYALERCVEEMYENKSFGLYKFGYIEDLSNITSRDVYEQYQNLINTAKIDIFVSGDFKKEDIEKILNENRYISKLVERKPNYVINNETTEKKELIEEKEIKENMDVVQGKIVIGIDILENAENSRYAMSLYSTILGASPNSKLFQNVREKESLAYSIGSMYLKTKNNIFIKAGIEIENYEKTIELIKKEIEDMKNGKFTEEDIENAKKFISYGVKAIIEEQEIGISYYLGQELAESNISPEKYIENINNVTKEDIENIANKIRINTIYFLTNNDK